jgi:nicotinamidase-related amidase
MNARSEARDSFRDLAKRPAVVTIDLHRGHLDPAVATLPLPAESAAALINRVVPLLEAYRSLSVPIIHLITAYRDQSEILSNPYWSFQAGQPNSPRSRIAFHNLAGGAGLALMPGVAEESDLIIATKKRYDCFIGTDLEFVLRSGRHDSLLVLGVNTNSCVIATAIAASVRDFAVYVVDEGVDTMMGPELDAAARSVIDASFGWFIPAATTLELLREGGNRVGSP